MSLQLVWTSGSGKPLEGEGSLCISYAHHNNKGQSNENIQFSGSNMSFTFKSGSEMIIGEEKTAESFYRFGKDGDISFSKAGDDAETVLRMSNDRLEVMQRDDVDASPAESGLGNLIPDRDDFFDIGKSDKQFKDLWIDGTANIDSLNMGSTVTINSILDQDNMSSNSATSLATQQSIKAYVDANGGGTVDSSLSNSSTNAVRNSAVHAGLATKQDTIDASNRLDASLIGANGNVSNAEFGYLSSVSSDIQTQLDAKLPVAGGAMKGLIQEPYVLTDSATIANAKGVIDARATRVFQILNQKGQTWNLIEATPAYRGQELTIIAMGAGTITHTNPGKLASGIFVSPNGSNISVAANTVVKFVANFRLCWYQVV